MVLRRVVVTGLGALTPIGNNVQEYWNATNQRRKWCINLTFKTKFACRIENFNAEDFLDRKKLEKWTVMLNIWSSAEAINDAAFLKNLDKDRAGVIWDQVVA
jgi:3-oxoacyl-[acyl-carrier-protein] synthase II